LEQQKITIQTRHYEQSSEYQQLLSYSFTDIFKDKKKALNDFIVNFNSNQEIELQKIEQHIRNSDADYDTKRKLFAKNKAENKARIEKKIIEKKLDLANVDIRLQQQINDLKDAVNAKYVKYKEKSKKKKEDFRKEIIDKIEKIDVKILEKKQIMMAKDSEAVV